jgi:hypothetical protein
MGAEVITKSTSYKIGKYYMYLVVLFFVNKVYKLFNNAQKYQSISL